MKQALLALPLITMSAFAPLSAEANYYQPGGVKERTCYKEVYREEYVPGTQRSRGYVRSWVDKKRVPCKARGHYNHPRNEHRHGPVDDNSCIEGSVIGGIAGGALGGVLSTEENWIWAIPSGVIGGALAGCQIDGG